MGQPARLSEKIDSCAYGETPPEIAGIALDALDLRSGDLFVDLGCGAGNVCAQACGRGARVLGIEQNPELYRLGLLFLSPFGDQAAIRCEDFTQSSWAQQATIAYATTARFPQSTLETLARQAWQAPHLRAIATLGRPLPLKGWAEEELPIWPVCWNSGEAALSERLIVYGKPSL
jgi:hypothetical protein